LLSPNRILPRIRAENPNERRIIGFLPIRRRLATPNEVAASINQNGHLCGRHHLRRLKVLAKLRLRLADRPADPRIACGL
jgi:hypothetical protein